jgi:hypothetical protein
MTLSAILDLILCGLLALTLVYCIVLERRLNVVRKGQDSLKGTIRGLNVAIENASATLNALRAASAGAMQTLDERTKIARAVADELSLLTASGERIAERFDRAVSTRPAGEGGVLPSRSVMGRLDNLRAVR